MKKMCKVFSLIFVCLMVFQLSTSALMKYPMSYIYTGADNDKLNTTGKLFIPITHTVDQVYDNVVVETEDVYDEETGEYLDTRTITPIYGEYDMVASTFDSAADLFITDDNIMYIADKGNNRIVKMDQTGKTLAIYYGAYVLKEEAPAALEPETWKEDRYFSAFSDPTGVFADKDGTIYVADSRNKRIVRMNQEGVMVGPYDEDGNILVKKVVANETEIQVIGYGKPESELLNSTIDYMPSKVAVGSSGYIYTLVGKDFMAIDDRNNFRGYFGTIKVKFNPIYSFLESILTEEQFEKLNPPETDAYKNFTIDAEGRFLACCNADTNQIRLINAVGNNVYPPGFYGEVLSIDENENDYVYPNFADIASDKSGIVSALDGESGYVYQYDKEGNLLTVFGGFGENRGYFQLPNSVATDSVGNIYVLDAGLGNIQRFTTTEFMENIRSAATLYFDGKYNEAEVIWKEILEACSDYPLAHNRLGTICYKNGDYAAAQEHYLVANNMEGYSNAFDKQRHAYMKENFILVVVIIVVICAALFMLLGRMKKYSNKIRDKVYKERRGLQ